MLFLVSIVVILVVSKKSLPIALFTGTLFLGFTVLGLGQTINQLGLTLTDSSVLLLALVVGVIPLIGGVMEETGQMEHLVKNLRIGKKPFLAFAPALLGMLPMPGGALMSAPLVKKAGRGVNASLKVAINVWFRHVMLLAYPLAPSLIATAKIAGLGLYNAILWLFPFFLFSLIVGCWFFLRKVTGRIDYTEQFSAKWLLVPLAVILSAPLLDLLLRILFRPVLTETATLVAVSLALLLALLVGKPGKAKIAWITKKMKPWNFSLIIFGMFFFLFVFRSSSLPQSIALLPLNTTMLLVLLGFFLGFATGRIQVPASIIIPVFLAKHALKAMPPAGFAVMYFSIFLGYVASPVHPCVSVSLEYFKTSLSSYLKSTALPLAIAFAACIGVSHLML